MTQSLWPNFNLAGLKRTPKRVLSEAGKDLSEKTNGIVEFYVDSGIESDGRVTLSCRLYLRKIGYMYPFLVAKFPLADGYPVELVADKIPGSMRAKDEPELLDALAKIFQAPTTVETVERLIAFATA